MTANTCNQQRHWFHERRIKSIAKIELWQTHEIVKNAMSQLIHKSTVKTENSRPWNRRWILRDSRCMESAPSINSRPTHQIVSKTRVMTGVWNCQKKLCHYWSINRQRKQSPYWNWNRQWILSYADVCNRQRQRIHERRIKSIAKIESWQTDGIVKNIIWQLIHKSPAKTE